MSLVTVPPGGTPDTRSARDAAPGAGFTLVELVLSLIVVGIITGVSARAYREYSRATAVRQAAALVAHDVARARGLAVQRREPVSLVADEANRSYVIRNADGQQFAARDFGSDSDLPLTLLDLEPSDAITFSARGILVGASAATVELGRLGRTRRVDVSALGRTRIVTP